MGGRNCDLKAYLKRGEKWEPEGPAITCPWGMPLFRRRERKEPDCTKISIKKTPKNASILERVRHFYKVKGQKTNLYGGGTKIERGEKKRRSQKRGENSPRRNQIRDHWGNERESTNDQSCKPSHTRVEVSRERKKKRKGS